MRRLPFVLALATVLAFSVLPLARTLLASVLVADDPSAPIEFTLAHFEELATGRWRLLGNSVLVALGAAVISLLIGVPYAWLTSRSDLPGRRVVGTLALVPLVLPPLVVTLAWTFVPGLGPSPITQAPPPSVWDGPVAVLRASATFALCYFPLVVLFARRALLAVPTAQEEAGVLSLGRMRTLGRVTLPLAAPGIVGGALFVFLFALNDFAVVDFLNWVRPTHTRIQVYPFESFTAWNRSAGEGPATALGVPLAVTGVLMLLLIHRLVGTRPRAAQSAHGTPSAPWPLGPWVVPAWAYVGAVLAVSVGVPVVGLLLKAGGLRSYRAVWRLVATPEGGDVEIAWTLWFAFLAATIALLTAFSLAHHAARTRRAWIPVLVLLPLALPPIFLGAGTLRLLNDPSLSVPIPGTSLTRNPFLDLDGPQLGTATLLAAKYLPFALAVLWAAFLELDPRLEEAAASAGLRPLDRTLRIVTPLVSPAIGLAWVLVFVFSLREIDTVVLLTSKTVMRRLYNMMHFQRDEQVAALGVILMALQAIPFAVLALLAPRRKAAVPG